MYKIIDNGNIVNEEVIILLESFIECNKLPISYRNFLMSFNGGNINPCDFNFMNKNYGGNVNTFFKINSKDHDDWVENFNLYKHRIPLNFIAIANDNFGNLILLGIKGKDREKIYFWDHEFEVDDGEIASYDNLSLISNNFEIFLNSLFEEE